MAAQNVSQVSEPGAPTKGLASSYYKALHDFIDNFFSQEQAELQEKQDLESAIKLSLEDVKLESKLDEKETKVS